MNVQKRKRPARELTDRQLLAAAARQAAPRRLYESSRPHTIAEEADTCGARCGTAIRPGDKIVTYLDGPQHLDCPTRI